MDKESTSSDLEQHNQLRRLRCCRQSGKWQPSDLSTDRAPPLTSEQGRAVVNRGVRSPPLPLNPPSEVAESDIVSMVGLEGVPTSREQA